MEVSKEEFKNLIDVFRTLQKWRDEAEDLNREIHFENGETLKVMVN